MKVCCEFYLRKLRGTCSPHAPLISSFRPKLQRRSKLRRLSNVIESPQNGLRATGKAQIICLVRFWWEKLAFWSFCHVCMRRWNLCARNYGAQCFVQCTLCTQQMLKPLTALSISWLLMESFEDLFAFRKAKMEWAVVINFKPTLNWNRLCQASIPCFFEIASFGSLLSGYSPVSVSAWAKYSS